MRVFTFKNENISLSKSVVSLYYLCESEIAAAFRITAIVKNGMCYQHSELDILSTRARQSHLSFTYRQRTYLIV